MKDINNFDIIKVLNELIDDELENEEPDYDFIDECSRLIIKLESNDEFDGYINDKEFCYKAKRIKFSQFSKTAKIAIAVAVILLSSITAYATTHTSTGESFLKQIGITDNSDTSSNESTPKKSKPNHKSTSSKEQVQSTQPEGEEYCIIEIIGNGEYSLTHGAYSPNNEKPSLNYSTEQGGEIIENENVPCIDEGATHEWSEWEIIAKPTCGENGKKVRACGICQSTQTAILFATGEHTFSEEIINSKASEGVNGQAYKTCTICNKSYFAEISSPKRIIISTNDTLSVKGIVDLNGYEIPKDCYTVSINDNSIIINYDGKYYAGSTVINKNILFPNNVEETTIPVEIEEEQQ